MIKLVHRTDCFIPLFNGGKEDYFHLFADNSNITFWPFEQSWVGRSSDAAHHSKVMSVAVLPVQGDPEMSARLAMLLQQGTALRVEVPMSVAAGVSAADPPSAKADDADRSA